MGSLVVDGLLKVLFGVGRLIRNHMKPFACQVQPLGAELVVGGFIRHLHGVRSLLPIFVACWLHRLYRSVRRRETSFLESANRHLAHFRHNSQAASRFMGKNGPLGMKETV